MHGPAWGQCLYMGCFSGAFCHRNPAPFCRPHPSYEGCDFEARMRFKVKRWLAFKATHGFGFFREAMRFLPSMNHDEVAAFGEMYYDTSYASLGILQLVKDWRKANNIEQQLQENTTAITVCASGALLEEFCKCDAEFSTASFQVFEIGACTKEHAPLVASLFSDDNKLFNHDRMRCLRVVVSSDDDAAMGAEVARLCPKHLTAIEFSPKEETMNTSCWDIIMRTAANNALGVKQFIVNVVTPVGADVNCAFQAARKNPDVEFVLSLGKQVVDEKGPLLERIAQLSSQSFDVELPNIVPFREIKWNTFGLLSPAGLVPCDFKNLHKHSVVINSMYDAVHDGKEPSEPLERCTGTDVGVRPLVYQLVVFFVSAQDKSGKSLFASEEETMEEAKQKSTVYHLSCTDGVFCNFITKRSHNVDDEVVLSTEILGIASFLHIPALQRLARSHLVRLWKLGKLGKVRPVKS